jgi:hypothetical protein
MPTRVAKHIVVEGDSAADDPTSNGRNRSVDGVISVPILLLGSRITFRDRPMWICSAQVSKSEPSMTCSLGNGIQSVITLALLMVSWLATPAQSAEPDLQLWFPIQLIHPLDAHWELSMQVEPRLQNDISEFSQLVYKPAVNYHFNRTFAFSAGYKYIDKYHESNEQDIWQETHCNKKFDDLVTGFQVRLEERFIDNISGVIPRLRLLQHVSHPLGESPNYLTGFGAIRFNLDSKGEGPVSGFEQSRIYAAFGRHFGGRVQFECGYLWRYQEERFKADRSDHAIHFQLLVNTKAKRIQKPTIRDRYR